MLAYFDWINILLDYRFNAQIICLINNTYIILNYRQVSGTSLVSLATLIVIPTNYHQ